jgi:hypothetical protein
MKDLYVCPTASNFRQKYPVFRDDTKNMNPT